MLYLRLCINNFFSIGLLEDRNTMMKVQPVSQEKIREMKYFLVDGLRNKHRKISEMKDLL